MIKLIKVKHIYLFSIPILSNRIGTNRITNNSQYRIDHPNCNTGMSSTIDPKPTLSAKKLNVDNTTDSSPSSHCLIK